MVSMRKHTNESYTRIEGVVNYCWKAATFEVSRLMANLHERGMRWEAPDAIIKKWGSTRYG